VIPAFHLVVLTAEVAAVHVTAGAVVGVLMDRVEALAYMIYAEHGHDPEELIKAIAAALHKTLQKETLEWGDEDDSD